MRVFLFLVVTLGLLFGIASTSRAEGEKRTIQKAVLVSLTHWQLVRWTNGAIVCNMYLYHSNRPAPQDVTESCGQKVLQDWLNTPPCSGVAGYCPGLMLRMVSQNTTTYTQEMVLPEIKMRVETVNCVPGETCNTRPEIRVVAEEPVEGFQITNVHIRIGNNEKIYVGIDGQLKLPLTNDSGNWITYWAESSLGDQSKIFEVKYRSVKLQGGDTPIYRLDLINADWEDSLPAGSMLWEIFPPADEPLPKMFEQPLSPEYLATTNRYVYLAGHLIRKGLVDIRGCPEGAVLSNGIATPCGEKAAALQVLEWQNKYDQQIYQAALRYNVPARLLKGMIAQESQFWPFSDDPYEKGLGRVTENGVSMLLMWNPAYYVSLCGPVFGDKTCWGGYSNLREDRQAIMRGSVINRIGTSEEADVLAAMLYASAAQTRQLMSNVMHQELSVVTTYEDMWKMSLANYYSGSGCLGNTLREVAQAEPPITWAVLSPHLLGVCQIANDYVERVFDYSNSQ